MDVFKPSSCFTIAILVTNPTTESIIKKMTGVPIIGRIDEEPYFDKNVVKEYAEKFHDFFNK